MASGTQLGLSSNTLTYSSHYSPKRRLYSMTTVKDEASSKALCILVILPQQRKSLITRACGTLARLGCLYKLSRVADAYIESTKTSTTPSRAPRDISG